MKKLKNQELIKKWEDLRLEAYLPTPNDVWTIGWGHTQGVKKGDKITKALAEEFFKADVAWAEEAVNRLVKVYLNQYQFDSLVSLVFNIGETNFRKSTLLRLLNKGDYEGAANQILVWNKQKGKTLKGLVNRRKEERDYFLQGSTVEGPASASVEAPEKPSLTKDIPALAGAGGIVAALGSLAAQAQVIAVVALVVLGVYFIYTRSKER